MACGCSGGDRFEQPIATGGSGYKVTYFDPGKGENVTETYGSFVPASRRAREKGVAVQDAN